MISPSVFRPYPSKIATCSDQKIDGWDTDGIRMTYGHMEINLLFHYKNIFYLLRMEYGRNTDTDGIRTHGNVA